MSCSGCAIGSGSGTKPSGCGSSGGCATGGCNRLNTYDWLSDISFVGDSSLNQFVEISFKNGARKAFYKNPNKLILEKNDCVAVDAEMGSYDVGTVSLTGEMARLQMKRKKVGENKEMMRILRLATEFDLKKLEEARSLEHETMIKSRVIARQLNLDMKIGDVEYQGDGKKATFYYIADERVDFRELIKSYAKEFKVKVEMNHIGARQEAGRIGGIGSCGRELCCSTWLTEFKTVSTSAARFQNLSINQVKLSGQCGRLKCCLNYELDTYLDALQDIPQNIEKLETETGVLYIQKTDIFKKVMWFAYKESTVYHPLSIERVKEIDKLNKEGIKPTDLGSISLDKMRKVPIEKEPEFTDVVGQTTLESLGKKKKSKNKSRGSRDNRDRGPGNQNRPQGGGPQQGNQPRSNQPQRQGGAGGQGQNQPRPQQGGQPNQPRPQQQGGQPNQPRPQQGGQPPKPAQPQQGQTPRPPQEGGQPPKPQQPRRDDNRNRNQPRKPKW